MGRMKDLAITKDNEDKEEMHDADVCDAVTFLILMAETDGMEVDYIHCKCELCTSQDGR